MNNLHRKILKLIKLREDFLNGNLNSSNPYVIKREIEILKTYGLYTISNILNCERKIDTIMYEHIKELILNIQFNDKTIEYFNQLNNKRIQIK